MKLVGRLPCGITGLWGIIAIVYGIHIGLPVSIAIGVVVLAADIIACSFALQRR